jgi:hypothetical protein
MKKKVETVMVNNSTNINKTKIYLSPQTIEYKKDHGISWGGGAHLKKLRRAERGAICFFVFRVKNHRVHVPHTNFKKYCFLLVKSKVIKERD